MTIPEHVLSAFQVDGEVASTPDAAWGEAKKFGRIVISQAAPTAAWSGKVRERIADHLEGVHVARPVRATDGRFVVAGFVANEFSPGAPAARVDEAVAAALALVAAFVVTMLYSRAVLTELNQQIAAQTNALADAQSENTRLSAQLDAKVSLRNVEEYATQALGMVSIDKSQITYVDLSEGDKIELTMDSPRLSLIDRIRVAISNAKNPEG